MWAVIEGDLAELLAKVNGIEFQRHLSDRVPDSSVGVIDPVAVLFRARVPQWSADIA